MESILKSLTTQSQNKKAGQLLMLMAFIAIMLLFAYYGGCAVGKAMLHAYR